MRDGNQQFTPEHVLKVLLDDDQGMAASLIERAGGDAKTARSPPRRRSPSCRRFRAATARCRCRSRSRKVFDTAEEAAKKAGDSFVTVERLLLALAIEKSAATADILAKAGVTPQKLNQVINDIRKGRTADSANAEQGL